MALMLFLSTLATLPSPLPPQEEPPGATATAREIFDAAIRTQTPEGKAPEISSFDAEYNVELYENEQGEPTPRKSGTIHQWWQQRKGKTSLYRRTLKSDVGDGGTTTYLSDGRSLFLVGNDGRIHNLGTDPSLRRDFDALQNEVRRTDELMRLFFLRNLDGKDVTLTLGRPDLTHKSASTREKIAVDELVVHRPESRSVTLRIGKEDHRVYEVELPEADGAPLESFRFAYHELQKNGGVGPILVPMRVEYWKGDRLVVRANARELSDIRFNQPIPASTFRPE